METIFITARYDDDEFDTYLGSSLINLKTKCINVADKPDTDNIKYITTKYNIGIDIAKNNELLNNDTIVVFAKTNVHILDPLFSDKLNILFTEKPEIGVVGVLGVKEIHSGRSLYADDNKPVNGIIYKLDSNDDKGEHVQYSKNGFYDNVVGVDDSIIAVRGSLFINDNLEFKSDTNSGFGIEASIKTIQCGYDVAVADILVVSSENTDVSHDTVDDIITSIGINYPVNVKTLKKTLNSIIDIEI